MNTYKNYFNYKNNILHCEDVSLVDIAGEYGTPVYVYSANSFVDYYNEIDKALHGVEHLICYSVKSCSNINILKLMAELGSGMDVVSGGEIYRAIAAGVDPKKIVYAGVGKTEAEIEYALKTGIKMFNCESLPEIYNINEISNRNGVVADISIRVNPDVKADTHDYITTGKKENKFGIYIDHLFEALDEIKKLNNIRLSGIHVHIGSQITSIEPFVNAAKKVVNILFELQNRGFDSCKTLNLGGGFGIQYNDEKSIDIESWADEIKNIIKNKDIFLIIEPGRYIAGNSGALLTRIVYKKEAIKRFLIVDSGMHQLIRPTLYDAYQEILNVNKKDEKEIYDVVGPICESGDFFAKDREIDVSNQGEYLAVMSAGAYGMTMASRYNSHPLPAEVIVDGSNHKLIRKRESYEDLILHEKI